MALRQTKVLVEDLQRGMYVAALDRPWIETPFPLQGFFVTGPPDIDALRAWCQHVYVDVERGTAPAPRPRPAAGGCAPLKINRNAYPPRTTLGRELHKAAHVPARVEAALRLLWEGLRAGRPVDFRAGRRMVSALVASVVRNPDALTWLAQLRRHDDYSYSHAVRACIWATVFGRHLGLSVSALESLALGSILSDIGMLRVAPGADARERQRHVEHGVAMLLQAGGADQRVTAVVAAHHERFDGSGYPQGLAGDAIPYLGRIAGLAIHYDELVNPPGDRPPGTPAEAMAALYAERARGFQSQLVDEYIQALGIYPAGTLVELNSHEVGVVVEQNPERRLRPKVLLLTDARHRPLRRRGTADLGRPGEEDGRAIARSLPPGWGGLDPLAACRAATTSLWNLRLPWRRAV